MQIKRPMESFDGRGKHPPTRNPTSEHRFVWGHLGKMSIDDISSSSASEADDQYTSSDEELECQRVCDYSCENTCGHPEDSNSLDEMAMNSKMLLFALVPMIGRQLGSIFARRGRQCSMVIIFYLSFIVLRRIFGNVSY